MDPNGERRMRLRETMGYVSGMGTQLDLLIPGQPPHSSIPRFSSTKRRPADGNWSQVPQRTPGLWFLNSPAVTLRLES